MNKQSLLARWLNRKQAADEAPPGKPDPDGDGPTTYAQQRLWTLCQLQPSDPFYNSSEAYTVTGPLDVTALKKAYARVVGHHESLRTVFYEDEGGVPRQRLVENVREEFHLATEEREEEFLATNSRRPFDLAKGPLSRLHLLQKAPGRWVLLFVIHHIVSDEGSLANFRTELGDAYRSITTHELTGPAADSPPLSYATLALRQRERDFTPSLEFWKETLGHAPATSTIPQDQAFPDRSSHDGARRSLPLTTEMTARIVTGAREAGTTPFVFLLTAYYTLLQWYSGQADLIVGTPVSNRDRTEYEPMIGLFNETVLLRQRIDLQCSFTDLVEQVKKAVVSGLTHKDTPFEAIVRALNPPREPGINPLFQTMFLHPEDSRPPDFGSNLAVTMLPFDPGTAKFDLTLSATHTSGAYELTAEYATGLYGSEFIDDLLVHYRSVVEQALSNPRTPLVDLPLLSAEAYRQIRDWNTMTPPEAPTADTIHELILRRAKDRPATCAVVAGDRELTYAQLEDRAVKLATELSVRGVKKGDIVGLHVHRSPDMIVGIYGILKAGAAYLPLDPGYPADRRRFMIEDSGARYVVVDTDVSDLLTEAAIEIINLDNLGDWQPAGPQKFEAASSLDPAYLIYTSGSTGVPKGVQISHGNLLHSTLARTSVYGPPPGGFLLLSSFSFDSSVAGIFWTLTGGGTLVIAPERAEQDMNGLGAMIEARQLTHTLLLPTLYGQLLEFVPAPQLASLNTVIVAGEACNPKVVGRHLAVLPAARLFNEYGPTEATVWATVHQLSEEDASGPIPIGRPVPFTQIYLTDAVGRLAPVGVPAELCIGGAGLATGYWKRPDLTARRFVTLTLPDGRQERVYRTGDLVRYRRDGSLLFNGRIDEQVKIRGYRVELGEVRNALLALPGVVEAEALVDDSGRRLLAYVVYRGTGDAATLSARIGSQLPVYMTPDIVLLDALPRLPNGKPDRGALLQFKPAQEGADAGAMQAPTSATEETLLKVWQRVLGQEDFGVTDNFFSLGGDSILSIRVVAQARREGLELPATAIFDKQTVRQLATVARPSGSSARDTLSFTGPVPLMPIQHWFFSEHRTAPHHWNHAWRFDFTDAVDEARLREVATAIYTANEALRQNFVQASGSWTSVIREAAARPCFFRLALSPDEIDTHLAGEQERLDLTEDALFRVYLFKHDAGGCTVIVLAHHLVVDMVSWATILTDLAEGMNAAGNTHGVAYHRWAEQLVVWAKEGKFDDQIGWWHAQQATPLDIDYQQSLPVTQRSIRVLEKTLDVELTASFLREANAAYGTRPEELLLTAFLMALRSHTGGARHCVNMERHGREPLDSSLPVHETLGWFTVSYPLSFQLPEEGGEGDIGACIVAVKERLRSVPDNGIGYGVLRYLAGHDDLRQAPGLFFNFLGQRPENPTGPFANGTFLGRGLRHPEGEVNRVWEVNAEVASGRLTIYWSYSSDLHKEATVESMLRATEESLRQTILYCMTNKDRTLTPSDFPEAGLTNADLQNLLGEFNP